MGMTCVCKPFKIEHERKPEGQGSSWYSIPPNYSNLGCCLTIHGYQFLVFHIAFLKSYRFIFWGGKTIAKSHPEIFKHIRADPYFKKKKGTLGLRLFDYVRLLAVIYLHHDEMYIRQLTLNKKKLVGGVVVPCRFPCQVAWPRGVYGFHDGDLGWTFGALGPELILANNINPTLSGFICGFKTG